MSNRFSIRYTWISRTVCEDRNTFIWTLVLTIVMTSFIISRAKQAGMYADSKPSGAATAFVWARRVAAFRRWRCLLIFPGSRRVWWYVEKTSRFNSHRIKLQNHENDGFIDDDDDGWGKHRLLRSVRPTQYVVVARLLPCLVLRNRGRSISGYQLYSIIIIETQGSRGWIFPPFRFRPKKQKMCLFFSHDTDCHAELGPSFQPWNTGGLVENLDPSEKDSESCHPKLRLDPDAPSFFVFFRFHLDPSRFGQHQVSSAAQAFRLVGSTMFSTDTRICVYC